MEMLNRHTGKWKGTRLSQAWIFFFLVLWIPSPVLSATTAARSSTSLEDTEGGHSPGKTAQDLDDLHSLLFRANQAYLEDHYEEAARLYERIVQSGHLNGHVFFNLGNTYVRLGELGKAILYYRKATILLPRDGDLKANLQYARSLAKDRIEEGSPSLWNTLAFWYFGMNFQGLLVVFVLFNLLFWAMALISLYRNREWVKWTLWLSLLLSLVLGVSAGLKYRESFLNAGGVLLEDEVPVRAGFSRNDTTLFVLHEGAEFTVLDQEKGWWKITLADGKKGWVTAGSVGRVGLALNQAIVR